MMKFIYIFLFSIQFTFASEFPSCNSLNVKVKTFVEQKIRNKKRKVVSSKVLVDLNPQWSIHSGIYDELVIETDKDISLNLASFNYVTYKNERINKKIKLFKQNKLYVGANSKINNFMSSWISKGPGDISVTLFSNNKALCSYGIEVVKGD